MADYTEGMSALHHILTQTPMNTTLSKKGQLPPFTASHLKEGLRTSWTAEQIGRLAIKYESEWYADSSLSKWNEIDHFYQTACENKRQRILAELDECHITKPAEREYPLKLLNVQYQSHIDTWQIEKAQRIKPSLWWDEVAKAQASQTTNTDTATTDNAPVLSNLSPDGKAWYLHPAEVMGAVTPLKITVSMLKQIFNEVPKERLALLEFMASDINAHLEEYKLDTPLRLSHFFAQIKQEARTNLKILENFSYGASYLKSKKGPYKYFRDNPSEADKYGYKDDERHFVSQENQKMIANLGMGDNKSLGNLGSNTDDGWNFRGRGLKQLTGRANYTQFTKDYSKTWSDDVVDFVNNPDLLHTEYKYIVRSGIYFWLDEKLYLKADKGHGDSVVDTITKVINRHTKTYPERKTHFKEIYHDKNI